MANLNRFGNRQRLNIPVPRHAIYLACRHGHHWNSKHVLRRLSGRWLNLRAVIAPLIILTLMALIGQGMGSVETTYTTTSYGISGFYDSTEHLVCYANQTAFDEAGNLSVVGGQNYAYTDYYWTNATNSYEVYINNNPLDEADSPRWIMVGSTGFWGVLVILGAVMALGCLVGFRVFNTGEGDFSASLIVKGTAFGSLWAFLAAINYSLLLSLPLYLGPAFLFILSLIYLYGVISSFGGNSG